MLCDGRRSAIATDRMVLVHHGLRNFGGCSKILTVYSCPRLFKTNPVDFRVRELPLGHFRTATPP